MIRGHGADGRVRRDVFSVHVVEGRRRIPEIQNHASPVFARRIGDQAAEHRCDILDRGDVFGQTYGCKRLGLARPGESLFRNGHEIDHALICLARGFTERENAVLQQDQAFDVRILFPDTRAGLRERKTGHDIRHQCHAVSVEILAYAIAIRLVGDRQDCIGMGVIDEFVRQECMQQGLDRRIGRGGIEQCPPLRIDHVLVR